MPRRTVQRVPTRSAAETGRPSRARAFLLGHLGPSLKFLTVGGIVFLIDAAMYNLLVFFSPDHGWGHGVLFHHPVTAKVATIAFASVLTYVGNRLWTFGDRAVPHTVRSVLAFVLVNVVAAGLQLGCLAFSRYVLGLDSQLADNISGNGVGLVLGTLFRFWAYRTFVFRGELAAEELAAEERARAASARSGGRGQDVTASGR